MATIKNNIKQLLSELHFRVQQSQFLIQNLLFKSKHPSLAIPPDKDLFDTFKVNYALYFSDGKLAAKEMIDWSKPYLPHNDLHILDWGCGVGRVIQHIPTIVPKAICYGADINQQRIQWCRKNIDNVLFDCIEDDQLPYPTQLFDLVIGISVFTHIHGTDQDLWLKELHRIAKTGAVIILSTQGIFFDQKMSTKELNILRSTGWFSNNYIEKGHRSLSTFNSATQFKQLVEKYFKVAEFYEGKSHPEKLGGQDLWILIKQ